jgi:hypothetical protein
MNVKVISYGQKKAAIKTAQVVIRHKGVSVTRHLWLVRGLWVDMWGTSYNLPNERP